MYMYMYFDLTNKFGALHQYCNTYCAGNTELGPRFDKQGTFLPHSVLGPTDDYAAELKNTEAVRPS